MAVRDRLRQAGRSLVGAVTRRILPVVPRYNVQNRLLEVARKGGVTATRQRIPTGLGSYTFVRNGIYYPLVRPEALVTMTDVVWIVGAAVDRIVDEVTKGGYRFDGKFGAKCLNCGSEYAVEPQLCEAEGCFSTEFRPPDPQQLEGGSWADGGVKGVMERPNWDQVGRVVKTMKDLLKDWAYYLIVIDDWDCELVRDFLNRPRQMWSMNSEFIRRFEDPAVSIGNWFCPSCLRQGGVAESTYTDVPDLLCPKCESPLLRTAWAQVDDRDKIRMVWAAEEIAHGQARARGFRVHGRSKVLSVWAMGQIQYWQERYEWARLSMNKAPDALITVEGMDQSEVDDMVDELEGWKEEHPEYKYIEWMGLGTGGDTGGRNVNLIRVAGELTGEDMVTSSRWYMEAVAMRLGVSPAALGQQVAGQLGQPEEVLQVSFDTIEEVGSQLEEFFNTKLLPAWPEVTDWVFRINPPAPESEKDKAEEAIAWGNAVRVLRDAGAKVRLDPQADFDWPVEIVDWPIEEPAPAEGLLPGVPPGEVEEPRIPPPTLMRKARLPPRNAPPEDAAPGLRKAEEELLVELSTRFDKAVRDLRAASGRTPDEREMRQALGRVMGGLRNEFEKVGSEAILSIYGLGVEAAESKDELPAAFTGRDDAIVGFLRRNPNALAGSLSKVVDDFEGVMGESIRDSLDRGVDTGTAIREATEALGEKTYLVERVIRDQTTSIVNQARLQQFEKYGRPEDRYALITAGDRRVDRECLEIAFEDPDTRKKLKTYTLSELKGVLIDGRVHIGCRCTVRRDVEF